MNIIGVEVKMRIKTLNLENLGQKWSLKILNYSLGERWITVGETTADCVSKCEAYQGRRKDGLGLNPEEIPHL